MQALFAETIILALLIFALVTLIRRYIGRKRRIRELERELDWYRRAAMQGKMYPYQEGMEKRL